MPRISANAVFETRRAMGALAAIGDLPPEAQAVRARAATVLAELLAAIQAAALAGSEPGRNGVPKTDCNIGENLAAKHAAEREAHRARWMRSHKVFGPGEKPSLRRQPED